MTPFGKALRRERREVGMMLGQLAEKIGVSTPYLSQIETGVRQVNSRMLTKIFDALELNQADREALTRAAAASKGDNTEIVTINVSDASKSDRQLASHLALSFNRLTPEAKRRLHEMLKDNANG